MGKQVRAARAVVLSLALCLCGTYLGPPTASADSLARPVGGVATRGRVLINGAEVITGAAVFPGSKFSTEKNSTAEINMGGLGRIRCLAETAGTVNFGGREVGGSLDTGIIHVSKPQGVSATIATKDGSVVAGAGGAALFVVNVTGGNTVVRAKKGSVELRTGKTSKVITEGQDAAAGTQTTPPQDDDDDDDDGGWFWFGAVGYTAIVTAAVIWAVTREDEGGTGPGDPTVIFPPPVSPSR
ncbi:MAG: hypothetical protein M3416_07275 [Acidobacteriota bacterium]|nr:hypothetical protein [Acidobacteriota bacterium]